MMKRWIALMLCIFLAAGIPFASAEEKKADVSKLLGGTDLLMTLDMYVDGYHKVMPEFLKILGIIPEGKDPAATIELFNLAYSQDVTQKTALQSYVSTAFMVTFDTRDPREGMTLYANSEKQQLYLLAPFLSYFLASAEQLDCAGDLVEWIYNRPEEGKSIDLGGYRFLSISKGNGIRVEPVKK